MRQNPLMNYYPKNLLSRLCILTSKGYFNVLEVLSNNLQKCPVKQEYIGHFQGFKVILTSGGDVLKKITSNDSKGRHLLKIQIDSVNI